MGGGSGTGRLFLWPESLCIVNLSPFFGKNDSLYVEGKTPLRRLVGALDGVQWGSTGAVVLPMGYEYCSHPFSHRRSDFLSACGEWCGESKRDLRSLSVSP